MTTFIYENDTLEIDEVTQLFYQVKVMKIDNERSQDESINVASCSNQRRGRSKYRGSRDRGHSKSKGKDKAVTCYHCDKEGYFKRGYPK